MGQDCPSVLLHMVHSNNNNNYIYIYTVQVAIYPTNLNKYMYIRQHGSAVYVGMVVVVCIP